MNTPFKIYKCNEVRRIIKKRIKHYHKGDAGRICVVGGSKDYTGAPYLSAMASMFTGADLCYIWTFSEAVVVIKSYSPDLIVSPILDNIINYPLDELKAKLRLMDCLVIGPGLGRSDLACKIIKLLVEISIELDKPLVLDADSLYYFSKYKDLIVNYNKCILTPNHREIKYILQDGENKNNIYYEDYVIKTQVASNLKNRFPNNTIVCKGRYDVIINSEMIKYCTLKGSYKRSGGQGDVLCGIIATFFSWVYKSQNFTECEIKMIGNIAYESCRLMRRSAREAWIKHTRGMLASDILRCISSNFNQMYNKRIKIT